MENEKDMDELASPEEVYETEMEGEVSKERLEEFEKFEKKFQALLEEHGYGIAAYYLMKPINPDWSKDVGAVQWGMVHGIYNSKEILDAVHAHQKGIEESPDEPTYKLTKEQLHIVYEANMAMSSIYNRCIAEGYSILPKVMTLIEQIKQALGMDKARMIPIKCDTRYFVYTETGVKYMLSYDKEFKFTLRMIDGGIENPPDAALRFIGMVQKSGNIFHRTMDYPIVSTGDRMVFSKFASKEICFITGEVRDVQQVDSLN